MTITNYSDLQTEVADYTHRSDMTTRIPTFVQMCEADMKIRLKLVDFESSTTLAVTSSSASLPADFAGMRACYWDGDTNRPLSYLTPDAYNTRPDESGIPAFYTITGTSIKVKPLGDGSLVMDYLARFTDLATAGTNAIITKYPDAYLHGTLAQFCVFVKDAEGLAIHQAAYEQAIARIIRDNSERRFAGPLQVRAR